jgi:hypothetical protein
VTVVSGLMWLLHFTAHGRRCRQSVSTSAYLAHHENRHLATAPVLAAVIGAVQLTFTADAVALMFHRPVPGRTAPAALADVRRAAATATWCCQARTSSGAPSMIALTCSGDGSVPHTWFRWHRMSRIVMPCAYCHLLYAPLTVNPIYTRRKIPPLGTAAKWSPGGLFINHISGFTRSETLAVGTTESSPQFHRQR